MENEYISHHGVLGQKWGVRRYQNTDGSLTDKGRQHYYKTMKKVESLHKQAEHNKGKAVKYKSLAAKYNEKSLKKEYGGAFGLGKNEDKAIKYAKISAKYNRRNANLERKAYKEERKAEKLVNSLNKKYGNVSIHDLDEETIDRGKRYGLKMM